MLTDSFQYWKTVTSLDKLWFRNGYNQLNMTNKKLECMGHLERDMGV